MTVTVEGVDTDQDAVIEWDFLNEIACWNHDLEGIECPNKAEFKCMRMCCGTIVLYCEDCMLAVKHYLREWAGLRQQCTGCMSPIRLGPEWLNVLGRL